MRKKNVAVIFGDVLLQRLEYFYELFNENGDMLGERAMDASFTNAEQSQINYHLIAEPDFSTGAAAACSRTDITLFFFLTQNTWH
jgi:hypothetical protein